MEKLETVVGMIVEDVNKEESAIVGLFGTMVNFLFKTILACGIPFMLYVFLQFIG